MQCLGNEISTWSSALTMNNMIWPTVLVEFPLKQQSHCVAPVPLKLELQTFFLFLQRSFLFPLNKLLQYISACKAWEFFCEWGLFQSQPPVASAGLDDLPLVSRVFSRCRCLVNVLETQTHLWSHRSVHKGGRGRTGRPFWMWRASPELQGIEG